MKLLFVIVGAAFIALRPPKRFPDARWRGRGGAGYWSLRGRLCGPEWIMAGASSTSKMPRTLSASAKKACHRRILRLRSMGMADRARPRTCITERAVFAYHKTNYNRAIPLRSDLHHWIMGQGGYPAFRGTPGI